MSLLETMSVSECLNEAKQWYEFYTQNPEKDWALEVSLMWIVGASRVMAG